MKILITRSQSMNENTAAVLVAMGYEPVECPLVEIVDTGASIPATDFGGVIFTSQAAMEILAEREKAGELLSRSLKVFAVGERTAEQARALGFTDVVAGEGGAGGLVDLIDQSQLAKPLLYLAGVDRAVELTSSAVEIILVEIYQAQLLDPGKDRLQIALSALSDGCAFLYSVRTASHLLELISRHNLERTIENVAFIAISETVANAVASEIDLSVLIAPQPNQMAMIDLVREVKTFRPAD